MESKYKLFKNFMHNELGITKDDIKMWTKEVVSTEVEKMFKDKYSDFNVEKIAEQEVRRILSLNIYNLSDIKANIAKGISEKIVLRLLD